MPLTATTDAGIVSNPDPLPANGAATLVTTGNWSDPQQGNVTLSVSGRTVRTYTRNKNHYAVDAGN